MCASIVDEKRGENVVYDRVYRHICITLYWWREAKKKNGKPEILYTDNRIHTPLDCGVAEQRI